MIDQDGEETLVFTFACLLLLFAHVYAATILPNATAPALVFGVVAFIIVDIMLLLMFCVSDRWKANR